MRSQVTAGRGFGRRLTLALAVALLSLGVFVAPALADATWKGHDWTGPATLSGDNLVVENDGSEFPAAHTDTSPEFRAQAVQVITVTFIDSGNTAAAAPNVMIEDEDAGQLITFGGRQGQPNYEIGFFSGSTTVKDTGVPRSAGEHKVIIALSGNWIDFVLDGVVVGTQYRGSIDKFGDVYLRARGGVEGQTVTYTDYSEDSSYDRPLPETSKSFAWFYGNCYDVEDEQTFPTITAQSAMEMGHCRGFGLFFGAHNATTLNAAIRNEAFAQLGYYGTAVVTVYAFQAGSQFVQPIIISGGSCEAPAPFNPHAEEATGAGLWIAWFSIDQCDTF
jgi:hypothetical protein